MNNSSIRVGEDVLLTQGERNSRGTGGRRLPFSFLWSKITKSKTSTKYLKKKTAEPRVINLGATHQH